MGGAGMGGSGAGGAGSAGASGAGAGCDPLAVPAGATTLTPADADRLPALVRAAAPGSTFLLADGVYKMTGADEASRRIQIAAPGVTLRGASGGAASVTIDGEYRTNELVTIHASDVTLAHLTLTHAVDHLVHVTPMASDVTGVRLFDLNLFDGGEQFVKVNPDGARTAFVDRGTLECSRFQLTDAGRPHVERDPGGCYTGGIDAHAARGWVVRKNVFSDLYCAGEGLAEHAVHFWSGSKGTLVERNVILGCARGIGFGLGESGAGRVYADDPAPGAGYVGHYDGLIRNNVVYADHAWFDTGIGLEQAREVRVLHNTVTAGPAASGFYSGIDARFSGSVVFLANDLARRITIRDGAAVERHGDLETDALDLFVDPAAGDLHLRASAAAAIDRGSAQADAGLDLDGEAHDRGAPDLGADER